jgi:hypothetical protein
MNNSENSFTMSKADFLDWLSCHGCDINPLPESKANVVQIINPKNNSKQYIDLPINKGSVKDYTIYRICTRLNIPIPSHTGYMKELHDNIEKDSN